MNDNAPKPFMSRASLAWALDVSESTVDALVQRGVLPKPLRLSPGVIRWDWAAVRASLASVGGTGNDAPADPFMAGVQRAAQKANEGSRGTA